MGCGASLASPASGSRFDSVVEDQVHRKSVLHKDHNRDGTKAHSTFHTVAAVAELLVDIDRGHSARRTRVPAEYCGVTLSALRGLRKHMAGAVGQGLSMAQLVEEYVKPTTLTHECRLADLLPRDALRPGEYFVSHAWLLPYEFTLDQIEAFARSEGLADDASFWLDIIAVNQHPGSRQDADIHAFARAVNAAGSTLLVLDEAGTPLKRVWCVYEIWVTLLGAAASKLRVLHPSISPDRLRELFHSIDVEAAQASNAADRERILADVRGSIGSEQLNRLVKHALVDSLALMAPARTNLAAIASAWAAAAAAHQGYGGMEGAAGADAGGADADDALVAGEQARRQGKVLMHSGRYRDAEPYFRAALQLFARAYRAERAKQRPTGSGEELLLATGLHDGYHDLATLLFCAGRFREAEQLHRRALQLRVAGLGEDDVLTSYSLNNLAEVLVARVQNQEEGLAEEDGPERAPDAPEGGPEGPERASESGSGPGPEAEGAEGSMRGGGPGRGGRGGGVAAAAGAVGRGAGGKLEPGARGPSGPGPGGGQGAGGGGGGTPGQGQGQGEGQEEGGPSPDEPPSPGPLDPKLVAPLREAERLYRQCLEVRLRTLGPAHPLTATTQSGLARALLRWRDPCRLGEAQRLAQASLGTREQVFGPTHFAVAASLDVLAECLEAGGDLGAAEALCRRALAIRAAALGPSHPLAAESAVALARVLTARARAVAEAGVQEAAERAAEGMQEGVEEGEGWVVGVPTTPKGSGVGAGGLSQGGGVGAWVRVGSGLGHPGGVGGVRTQASGVLGGVGAVSGGLGGIGAVSGGLSGGGGVPIHNDARLTPPGRWQGPVAGGEAADAVGEARALLERALPVLEAALAPGAPALLRARRLIMAMTALTARTHRH
ncbi:hypothetical protein HYH03_007729 [Edaphochlamys debaryana]|uniref:Tetratricopeptide repeat protein n=1 Tax=Edaphochlamys debaryana TaxID=47281 RepID=A0A835YAQ2_9CHLO|nr:hypothetical protein HYH03_007729 [Edaphochlamys debaryana]|eukprot:KAG2494089.1 hypothetical protein HYH03_007729 [Edaphochlamys debaryana]